MMPIVSIFFSKVARESAPLVRTVQQVYDLLARDIERLHLVFLVDELAEHDLVDRFHVEFERFITETISGIDPGKLLFPASRFKDDVQHGNRFAVHGRQDRVNARTGRRNGHIHNVGTDRVFIPGADGGQDISFVRIRFGRGRRHEQSGTEGANHARQECSDRDSSHVSGFHPGRFV